MVLARLRLTFPLSTFGIRYWPINLAGCLERGKWKEVFVSVKEMAWFFYFSFINYYEWFHFCIPSTQYYLIFSYCSKIWNYDEILRHQQISMIFKMKLKVWCFSSRIRFNLAFWTPTMPYVCPSGTLSWINRINTFKKTLKFIHPRHFWATLDSRSLNHYI